MTVRVEGLAPVLVAMLRADRETFYRLVGKPIPKDHAAPSTAAALAH